MDVAKSLPYRARIARDLLSGVANWLPTTVCTYLRLFDGTLFDCARRLTLAKIAAMNRILQTFITSLLSKCDGRRLLPLVTLLLVASCTGGSVPPDPSGPVLTGFDALPKQLATIHLSPTPNAPDTQATQIQATIVGLLPTATRARATPTPTTTPYVGVFLGAATFEPGDITNQKPIGTLPVRGGGVGGGSGPIAVPTLALIASPVANVVAPVTGGNAGGTTVGDCTIPPAPPFANATQNPLVRGQIGCPSAPPFAVNLVQQSFQKGFMFWRDTRQIYVVSTSAIQQNASVDTLWVVTDGWNEGMPASDASFSPPEGLLQPVRGFGLVWRSNQPMRDTLGWALAGEQPFQATWQDFERGWMMTSADGRTFALVPGNPTGVHFGPLS